MIRSATRLFLLNGFSNTTVRMIGEDCGMRIGTVAYHFHTKEDMLYLLIQELMDFHSEVIEEIHGHAEDVVLSYCMEVAVQIALCETDEKARDLYYSAYAHPGTLELIKSWSAKKNARLLKSYLPDWTKDDFQRVEHVASMIEFSAFTSPCDEDFTLEDKTALILESLMKLYCIPEEERLAAIETVRSTDCRKYAAELFKKFVDRLDNSSTA
ncbi:MAG: TetR/AcrR family transcriptional regulator [Clostridia bacterium]|nr:TetR/AcrR family transcriptional regulator [Clostridia bacterium]